MKAVNAVTASWPGLRAGRPSFAAVAEAELDALHGYLLFLTGNRSVAEDLTGETFEKAWRSWRRFDPRRGTARAWLCRIARRTALDYFSHRRPSAPPGGAVRARRRSDGGAGARARRAGDRGLAALGGRA
jgi:DNA-directed RNA polymerase specialized sigma24 family protein